MGCTVASAVAAMNALVSHLKLGNFCSSYESREYPLNHSMCGMHSSSCEVTSRTDSGVAIDFQCIVVKDENHSQGFPVKKVDMVRRGNLATRSSKGRMVEYYECLFTKDGIKVNKLNEYPF